MKESVYVKVRNTMHPGYSKCSRCGGNWGWKKPATHNTKADGSKGIFLFCKSCDKKVTPQERWEALDQWKAECICQMGTYYKADSAEVVIRETKDILATELIEFPRT